MLVLAFLGGVLTILSPCILPVIPLVFARAGRSLARDLLPMLAGLALAFAVTASIATGTARWLLIVDTVGRYAALLLLAVVGLTGSERGDRSLRRAPVGPVRRPDPRVAHCGSGRQRCAARRRALLLLLSLGAGVIARIKRAGAADVVIRRTLGAATLATVVALSFGWDRALFARLTLVRTASAETRLVDRFAPGAASAQAAGARAAGGSLDDFVADERARVAPIVPPRMDGQLPGFDGATEWINSPPLTAESLRGKVVLVDFWTFGCYNCLNALPHVKALYAKYKDRGFVVVGVHTPEFARERVVANVRSEVRRLDVRYPVVVDIESRIWRAFHNQYWPAAYYADATGKLRFHHFGEGRYEEQDRVVASLLAERDAALPRGAP